MTNFMMGVAFGFVLVVVVTLWTTGKGAREMINATVEAEESEVVFKMQYKSDWHQDLQIYMTVDQAETAAQAIERAALQAKFNS